MGLLLRILDSYPSRPKARFRGQSLVEMAVTTPVLFLLIAGLAEVGYLAANYIILTDALRTGARYGVNQDITQWKEVYSRNAYREVCFGQPTLFDYLPAQNNTTPYDPGTQHSIADYHLNGNTQIESDYTASDDTTGNASNWKLFDGVACEVLNNMSPLTLDPAHDDIAVSVIAYTGHQPDYSSTKAPSPQFALDGDLMTAPAPFLRYPQWNSYCASNANTPGGDDTTHYGYAMSLPGNQNLPGYFHTWTADNGLGTIRSAADGAVRGFVLTGNMKSSGCVGSYFYLGQYTDNNQYNIVYQLRNSASTLDPAVSTAVAGASRNGSLVIAEIQYTHHVLLGFPPFNFIGGIPLHLWSVFPQFSSIPPNTAPGSN